MYVIDIITIFPEIFENFLKTSIVKRAQDKKKVKFNIYNLRDFCLGKHKIVDDEPYGGGAGMVLKPDPIIRAVRELRARAAADINPYVVLLTPQGNLFKQQTAMRFSREQKHLILICGRYEGFDERVLTVVDEEISIGDFVLNGGEIPAMAISEAIVRLIPDVLTRKESFENDSFFNKYLDYPQYTRPVDFEGNVVPQVLVSGHHEEIAKWRQKQAKLNTYRKRPDLLEKQELEEIESEIRRQK